MSGENSYLITADGRRFPLAEYGVEIADLGSVPVEYETSRGYGQHGVTVHDWRLAERVISFILSGSGRNRARYWTLREQIIEALRPNRGGALTLRIVLPGGARRDIRGWLQSGPALGEAADGLGLDATFSLLCPDPAFYDPALTTVALQSGDVGGFYFPLAFPIDFAGGAALSATITVGGTWLAYPTLAIAGPYTGIILRNSTTGGYLTLSVAIAAGETRVIDLTPGSQSVRDGYGNDRITELSDGDLLAWYLAPGENLVSATIAGHDANTGVTVNYRTRYIAL